ncbi:hypothetical protein [Lacticaseibacillus sharpeae]|uniref:Uncharacterized protein n=1 Tax=Lacticaseibacillus sharpeae JCM 1186 = DSM 20505 TaxID=1291052 RepID=A0A0R1ZMU7_9LACO|nr:hypothetical protein [Lacticaseibacillus sharpeae]KRM54436.1 hypothetical protein FC18_GL000240 [Lacticaseibacillus sharpeae JCM 1186 = DSM 20505]
MTRNHNIPKRAIYQAIDRGVRKAQPKRKFWHSRAFAVALGIFLVISGATAVGAATGHLNLGGEALPHVLDAYRNDPIKPNAEHNRQAQAFTMHPGKTYVAQHTATKNQVAITPGFYDITNTSTKSTNVMGSLIPAGATYTGMYVRAQNALYDLPQGTVARFTPAKFKHLTRTNGKYRIASPFGSYNVGTQIPAGYYKVHVNTKLSKYHIVVSHNVDVVIGDTRSIGITFDMGSAKQYAGDKVIQLADNNPLTIADIGAAYDMTGKANQGLDAVPAGSIVLEMTKISKVEAEHLGFDTENAAW